MSNSSSSSSGISAGFLLFLVFLVLKLCNIINWSWWWVTSPLWLGIAIVVGFFIVGLIVGGIIHLLSPRNPWKRKRW
jgi:hypothetical protein